MPAASNTHCSRSSSPLVHSISSAALGPALPLPSCVAAHVVTVASHGVSTCCCVPKLQAQGSTETFPTELAAIEARRKLSALGRHLPTASSRKLFRLDRGEFAALGPAQPLLASPQRIQQVSPQQPPVFAALGPAQPLQTLRGAKPPEL